MVEAVKTERPHIVRLEGVCGGEPVIDGLRVTVRHVVTLHQRGESIADEVCDTMRDHSRLAGPGSSEDQQWAVSIADRFLLFCVETGQEVHVRRGFREQVGQTVEGPMKRALSSVASLQSRVKPNHEFQRLSPRPHPVATPDGYSTVTLFARFLG